MKRNILLLLFSMFVTLNIEAQVANYTIVTTPPSCSTCCDGTASIYVLNPSCSGYSVMWADSAGTPMGVTQQISNCCAGAAYTATVTGVCGTVILFCNFPAMTTGLNSITHDNKIILYPNPTSNIISLNVESISNFQNSAITIQNILGETVKKILVSNAEPPKNIDVSELRQGYYFLQITLPSKEIYKAKFIKQ